MDALFNKSNAQKSNGVVSSGFTGNREGDDWLCEKTIFISFSSNGISWKQQFTKFSDSVLKTFYQDSTREHAVEKARQRLIQLGKMFSFIYQIPWKFYNKQTHNFGKTTTNKSGKMLTFVKGGGVNS